MPREVSARPARHRSAALRPMGRWNASRCEACPERHSARSASGSTWRFVARRPSVRERLANSRRKLRSSDQRVARGVSRGSEGKKLKPRRGRKSVRAEGLSLLRSLGSRRGLLP